MSEETDLSFVEFSINNITNVTECCRACMRIDSDLTPIVSEDEDTIKLCDKLSTCVSEIVWVRKGVQSSICQQCIDRLRNAYDFRQICLQADQVLQKCFAQCSNEEKIEESRPLNTPTKFEFITAVSTSPMTLIQDDSHSAEYMNLKHLLNEDEDMTKIEIEENIELMHKEIEPKDMVPCSPVDTTNEYLTNCSDVESSTPEQEDDIDKSTEQLLQGGLVDKINVNASEKNRITRNETEIKVLQQAVIVQAIPELDVKFVKTEPVFKTDRAIQVRPEDRESLKGCKTKPPYICSECGKCYRKNANLRIHMRTHTGEKPFECKYCEKKFYHSSHLREHIRRHTGEKPFQCSVCSKRFTIRGELTMHMRTHTGEKPFACTVCERKCLSSADLKVHMRTHTGEKPYECLTCGKKFASTYILSSHRKIHTGERPHVCATCNKAFTQASHLKAHQRKHTGEKVVCKVCNAEFMHSSQLTVHTRKHTGKQPYKCDFCDKVCNYFSELQTHLVKHTGAKFSCLTCEKQFTSGAYLQEHMRTHTGQNLSMCSICSRQFTRHQYLEKHMRTHTGEKPFSCLECGKKFTQSSSLKVHIRIHTGEKPYVCTLCDKKFNNSSDLNSHQKTHKKYINL